MNIRIYQVNMSRDVNNVGFASYENLEKWQGTSAIDSTIYDKVFSGEVKCKTLEDVYVKFNQHHPRGYKARSLSKSDIVEIIGKDGKSEFHYCDAFGFKKVNFEPEKAKLSEMLKMADSVLSSAVSGISDLITCPGLINVDFADVRTAMSGTGGMAMMGMGVASGEGRALAAAKNAINCALLDDVSIAGAKSVLINITANEDLTMEEYGEANNYITECASAEGVEPQIFAGIVIDPNAGDEIRVSVIATGIESTPAADNAKAQTSSHSASHTAAASHTGSAIQAPTVRASEPRVIPSRPRSSFVFDPSEDRSKPTYLRMREREQQASHNPGHEDSFVFSTNEEDIELPSYFRTQAN